MLKKASVDFLIKLYGVLFPPLQIIQIARSPDANSSIVNVTFRVLNGSEPLLAYTVIQGISNDNVTLAEAVKYEVCSPVTLTLV